ncbi:MAG TPA: hypothetical protein VNW68_01275, partial [Candidatus Limnocylindria bacterium]|nr:hypothetical protein [Candidatus Limnocylindria bacterium]
LQLKDVLGSALPLGSCPHDHACIWRELGPNGEPSHTEALATNSSCFQRHPQPWFLHQQLDSDSEGPGNAGPSQ